MDLRGVRLDYLCARRPARGRRVDVRPKGEDGPLGGFSHLYYLPAWGFQDLWSYKAISAVISSFGGMCSATLAFGSTSQQGDFALDLVHIRKVHRTARLLIVSPEQKDSNLEDPAIRT